MFFIKKVHQVLIKSLRTVYTTRIKLIRVRLQNTTAETSDDDDSIRLTEVRVIPRDVSDRVL